MTKEFFPFCLRSRGAEREEVSKRRDIAIKPVRKISCHRGSLGQDKSNSGLAERGHCSDLQRDPLDGDGSQI